MQEMTTTGRFVWHELVSADPDASGEYYSKLFSWNIIQTDLGSTGPYRLIQAGEFEIGGIVPLEPATQLSGRWNAYISVDDVDETCMRVTELGGEVSGAPKDLPNIGRVAVIVDPNGGSFSMFQPFGDATPPEILPAPGTFCWHQLLTPDAATSAEFYESLFGYRTRELPAGDQPLHVFQLEGEDTASMMPAPEGEKRAIWLPYVVVEDLEQTVSRAEGLGGKIWVRPNEIPGIGRFAVTADPEGAALALFQFALED